MVSARGGGGLSGLSFDGNGLESGDGVVDGVVFLGKAQTDGRFPLPSERVHGNGGNAVLPRPAPCQVAVGFSGLEVGAHSHDLEIPSLCGDPGEARAFEASKQAVAFGFIDGAYRLQVLLGFSRRQVLHQPGLNGCTRAEDVVLVDLPKLGREVSRGGHPAQFPTRAVKELAKASSHQRAGAKPGVPPRNGGVPAVVNHRSVHLVTQKPSVGAVQHIGQCIEHGGRCDAPRGVVGAVEDDQTSAGAYGVRQPLRVHVAIVVQERHADHMGVVQFCDRDVEVVTGVLDHHFVPGLQQRRHGRIQQA